MRITQRTAESETEKRERLQREREEMQRAIASYTGPVTKIPQGRTTWGWLGSAKETPRLADAESPNGRSD